MKEGLRRLTGIVDGVGIGFCLLEDYFHFIKLSEENYYLSYAPINLEFFTIAALNMGTLFLTVAFLILLTHNP